MADKKEPKIKLNGEESSVEEVKNLGVDVNEVLNDDKVIEAINSFDNEDNNNDDEFELDPRTGRKTFKLDKDGCRKGWEWDTELGRCVPTKEFVRKANDIANKPVEIDE